jgi:hypothetical protein
VLAEMREQGSDQKKIFAEQFFDKTLLDELKVK